MILQAWSLGGARIESFINSKFSFFCGPLTNWLFLVILTSRFPGKVWLHVLNGTSLARIVASPSPFNIVLVFVSRAFATGGVQVSGWGKSDIVASHIG